MDSLPAIPTSPTHRLRRVHGSLGPRFVLLRPSRRASNPFPRDRQHSRPCCLLNHKPFTTPPPCPSVLDNKIGSNSGGHKEAKTGRRIRVPTTSPPLPLPQTSLTVRSAWSASKAAACAPALTPASVFRTSARAASSSAARRSDPLSFSCAAAAVAAVAVAGVSVLKPAPSVAVTGAARQKHQP